MYIYNTNVKPFKLHLDSKNYTAKYSNYSNYIYELDKTIKKPSNMDILIGLDSFIFTNSIYNINSNNENFYYSFGLPKMAAVYNLKLEHGNYSIDDFIDYMNERMITLTEGQPRLMTFSYNYKTLKIKIESPEPFRLALNLNGGLNNCFELMGFTNIDENLNLELEGNNIFNLNSNTAINIIMDSLQLNNNQVKNSKNENVLSHVPITSCFGEVQSYNNTSGFKYIVQDDYINLINIKLLNQDMKNINFNGLDWYICMTIDFIYKRDDKEEVNMLHIDSFYNKGLRGELIEFEKNQILNKK